MTRRLTVLVTAALATLMGISSAALVARGDIFQWEYINPADASQGKQRSTTFAPDGAGVNAVAGADLTLRDLTMAYLIGADLTSANAYSANLAAAELSQANLTSARLGAYVLSAEVGWDGAFLGGANLSQANLTSADFSGYYAYNADAPDPVSSSIYYFGANFLDANFTGADVRGANFTGSAGITLAQLYSTGSYQARDLTGIRLPGHNLAGANFAGQNLTNADLSSFQISSFHEIHSTDLTAANLANARFAGASLSNANLSGADARGALSLNLPHSAITKNLIQFDGRISGLNLTAGASLVIRDYDGNANVLPTTGPLPIVINEHLTTDATGRLRLEFDTGPWDSTMSFAPGIAVTLGGTLELNFAPGVNVAAQSGRTINLFDWAGVTPTGAFNVVSPYTWDLSELYTTGEVTLTMAEVFDGDFNGDSVIDGADLASWRAGFGTSGNSTHTQGDADGDLDVDGNDFLVWQRQLGSGLASAAVSAVVPEPTSAMLLLLTASALAVCRGGARTPGGVINSLDPGTPLKRPFCSDQRSVGKSTAQPQ